MYTFMQLTGSAAKGTGELEVLQGSAIAAAVTGAVGKAADSIGDELEKAADSVGEELKNEET